MALIIISTKINAQCLNYNCSSATHNFEFTGTLSTTDGYSNTNGDVCYSATNGIITTGTNYNNWNNLSFTSISGNFKNYQTLNVQANDSVYINTNYGDTVFMYNFQNFDGKGTININGNLHLNNVVVNNSFNDGSINKAIINMTDYSYIRLSTPNGIIEGYGYEIESLIPSELKVYNGDLIGYKAEGTLAVGHMTGKFIFFNICLSTPLNTEFIFTNIEKSKISWKVSNIQEVATFEIQSSKNSNDWVNDATLFANHGDLYSFEVNSNKRFYRIKMSNYSGKVSYSDVLVNRNLINEDKIKSYVDILGREHLTIETIPNFQVYFVIYESGEKIQLVKGI